MSESVMSAQALADQLERRALNTLRYIKDFVMEKSFTLALLGNYLGKRRKKKAVENDLRLLEQMGLIVSAKDGPMTITHKGWTTGPSASQAGSAVIAFTATPKDKQPRR